MFGKSQLRYVRANAEYSRMLLRCKGQNEKLEFNVRVDASEVDCMAMLPRAIGIVKNPTFL